MDSFSIRNGKYVVNLVCFVLMMFGGSVLGCALSSQARPKPINAAAFARWLVSESSWGVLSTIADDELGGAPFGNVVSFVDEGKGIPYFYLTPFDPTTRYAFEDHRISLTISEYALGTCGKFDPENPMCAKITLTGKLKEVYGNSKEAATARNALFAKHAEMQIWPKDHNFEVYKMYIDEIFLINMYGGPRHLTVNQYLHPGM